MWKNSFVEGFGTEQLLIVYEIKLKRERIAPFLIVVPLGIEPRLFCTKNRRVASYTMGHLVGKFNFIFFTYQIYFQGVCQFLYKTLVLIFVRYGLKIQSACFYFLFSHDLIP